MSNSAVIVNRTWFRPWMIASFALLVAGCVAQSGGDGKQTFQNSPLLSIGIILAGVIAIPIGFFWRKSDARLGWGLMIIVPIAAVVLAGTMGFEQVTVTDQVIEVRSGFFGSTTESIPFDQVKQIHISRQPTGRRGRMVEELQFQSDAGDVGRLRLASDVKTEASRAILDRAAARGIAARGIAVLGQ